MRSNSTLFPVVQLTAEDIERSSTLEPQDQGKWCFIVSGTLQGFFVERADAERRATQLLALDIEEELIG
ncbi:hypothetical protein EBU60_04165 [bacterium]|nr:hypothetical protein [bacterium]